MIKFGTGQKSIYPNTPTFSERRFLYGSGIYLFIYQRICLKLFPTTAPAYYYNYYDYDYYSITSTTTNNNRTTTISITSTATTSTATITTTSTSTTTAAVFWLIVL